ncbi:uncharacterized protein LOC106764427 isoform X5 [Vigna radiata var. radiata]|uniref:Uncharacterized protein LOC106764427 isoform X5 n=1 Tax=Vigna radiata var. radiata TaxID=3916 RepID=A0A3Q0F0M5_VIGRR|nr:uncharacterized protein LOC106764427 isoform X5 [Vigna radiata var. radiata]
MHHSRISFLTRDKAERSRILKRRAERDTLLGFFTTAHTHRKISQHSLERRSTAQGKQIYSQKCHKDHLPILRDNAVVYYIIYHVIDTPSIATNIQELYIDVGWLPKDICSLYTLIELFEIMQRAKSISLSSKIIDVLSMFPDELEDKCSPFTRMQTFELICDSSSSSAMPQDVKKYLFGEDNSSFTP